MQEMDLNNPLNKTGGVLAQSVASKHLRVDKPMKGDIFIMDFGGGKGHTGFVTQVIGDRINTVEVIAMMREVERDLKYAESQVVGQYHHAKDF